MNRIDEASYGRIYQHTRDNNTFAIIGSEDKDTHKNRYNELKQLIKKYERRYGHLGYNRLSGTYQYKLTGETTSEKSVIIYGISKKDALSIAKRINQESIIWKENNFFGIIDVKGGVLERFKKSTMNFSKAIKQGIGSKLQSDQSRTFGYAFEGRKIMSKRNLSEAIKIKLEESEKSASDLAKFIEESVNDLMTTSYTNCKYNLDEDLAVFVGWSGGYDDKDIGEYELYKEDSPTWRINVGIKVRNEADWADYDYLNFPWYPDGEVWDTGVTVNKDEDYMKIAEWELENYPNIVKAHNNGEIFYTSDEEEAATEREDNKKPWERY